MGVPAGWGAFTPLGSSLCDRDIFRTPPKRHAKYRCVTLVREPGPDHLCFAPAFPHALSHPASCKLCFDAKGYIINKHYHG